MIVLDRDCDIPFRSLNFMRFHSAPELLDQSTAPMAELARTRFRHTEPVIPSNTILFNAIAFENMPTLSALLGAGMLEHAQS